MSVSGSQWRSARISCYSAPLSLSNNCSTFPQSMILSIRGAIRWLAISQPKSARTPPTQKPTKPLASQWTWSCQKQIAAAPLVNSSSSQRRHRASTLLASARSASRLFESLSNTLRWSRVSFISGIMVKVSGNDHLYSTNYLKNLQLVLRTSCLLCRCGYLTPPLCCWNWAILFWITCCIDGITSAI